MENLLPDKFLKSSVAFDEWKRDGQHTYKQSKLGFVIVTGNHPVSPNWSPVWTIDFQGIIVGISLPNVRMYLITTSSTPNMQRENKEMKEFNLRVHSSRVLNAALGHPLLVAMVNARTHL